MTTVWKKIPRETKPCFCGCGELVTGTKRRMYARPYCKLKMHLRRKQDPNWVPDSRFNPNKPKENPLNVVTPTNWWKERWSRNEDMSSSF